MALLNNTQATSIYDNGSRTTIEKGVLGSEVYACHYLHGSLDGNNYYVDSSSSVLGLTLSSTPTEARDAIIAHLETMEYLGIKESIIRTVVELP